MNDMKQSDLNELTLEGCIENIKRACLQQQRLEKFRSQSKAGIS